MSVLVVGGGVSGLSCAIELRTRGHEVELWAERLPPDVTSSIAAAFWYPYKADPRERVLGWATSGYRRFAALAGQPETGVVLRTAVEVLREPAPRPWWAAAVPSLRDAPPELLPPGFTRGWCFESPVVDTRRYLPFLCDELARLGVPIVQRRLEHLDDAPHGLVVNCTGLGARELCGDHELFAIRGQLVHVQDPGLDVVMLDETDPHGVSYVVPRGDDCVLGGTADDGDDDCEPRAQHSRDIVARCETLVPALRGAAQLGERVGLRPGRASVRLELERRGGRTIVHDYGHGGAGVTLSWGCAEEVCALVADAILAGE
jgi:D-amino-acid oxidase